MLGPCLPADPRADHNADHNSRPGMKLSVRRSRLQYDSTMGYEKPFVVDVASTATVGELKQLISRLQRKLSTGESVRCLLSDSQPVVTAKDQALVVRRFRDPRLRGVVLEDHRSLEEYGLTDRIEENLFLRRAYSHQGFVADLLLLDLHYLTPGQRSRFGSLVADDDGLRRCFQQ